MGQCKYTSVSTNCFNNILVCWFSIKFSINILNKEFEKKIKPNNLIPFEIQQKQVKLQPTDKVTYLSYIEIKTYNVSVRLLTTPFSVTINGVPTNLPFSSNGININFQGGNIAFSTDFGLTIYWNNRRYDLSLCSAYSGFVCGLCGNGDGNIFWYIKLFFIILYFIFIKGNKNNDFVDKQNNSVSLVGDYYQKWFNWASSWRVNDPESDPNM